MKVKKQKNKKIAYNERGITLVALVVTIIVLIILAAVAINLVLGDNGILSKALYAKERYEKEQIKEKIEIEILEIQTEETLEGIETTLDTVLEKLPTKLSEIRISKRDAQLKGVYNNYEFLIDQNLKVTMLDLYTPITTKDLKEGDYIKYDTGKGIITCRVLYEASSQEGLQIITDKNIITSITIGEDGGWSTGKEKYNSAIKTLNDTAESYINDKYVVDARCVGSKPTVNEYGKMTEKDSEAANEPYKSSFTGATEDSGCRGGDDNYNKDLDQMTKIKNNGIDIIGKDYWLASRYVESETYRCVFYMRYINSTGGLDAKYICEMLDGYGMAFSDTSGFRACFSLKTDIEMIEGDGKTESSAYIME